MTDRSSAANSTYPKGGVLSSKDSLVVNQTLVFQIKFCGKSPALRVAAKRQVVKKLNFPKKLVVVGVVCAGVNLRCIGFLFFLCGF